ncbi:hypothetical protein ACJZ2D_011680 [Fusarium nematophilum]
MNLEASTEGQELVMETRGGRLVHKSTNGCMTCKKRKIKCDERQPSCKNCERFQVPCISRPTPTRNRGGATRSGRGPGRPRKNWDALMAQVAEETRPNPMTADAGVQCSLSFASTCPDGATASSPGVLSMADAKLFLHFTTHTGPSLVAPHDSGHSLLTGFWSHNALEIGLSSPPVLHLALSLAARHLAYLGSQDPDQKSHYSHLAEQHMGVGLAEMTRLLPELDQSNCGALYVSSLLVSYAGLAVGPRGPGDLLVCLMQDLPFQTESQWDGPWLPLVRGARLIRELFDVGTLFSGLMAPLGPSVECFSRPTFLRCGISRVDWVEPMREIRGLVEAAKDESAGMRRRAFNRLADIFEATFGQDDQGRCDVNPRNRFVFIWLYLIEDAFVDCVQRRDPVCLLLLAYYAVLMRTLDHWWFTHGWPEHLLTAIWEIIDESHRTWLLWPFSVTGMTPRKSSTDSLGSG